MSFHDSIIAIRSQISGGKPLSELADLFVKALSCHPEVCACAKGSYALATSDTGFFLAFRLDDTGLTLLAADEKTDVSISGKERDLIDVIFGRLDPLRALLTGKLRLKGDKGKLMQFARFL